MKISKLKNIVATLVISSIVFTGISTAFATENVNTANENIVSTKEYNDLKDEVNKITSKYGGEITIGEEALNELDSSQVVVKVSSKEELDNLIKSIREELSYCKNEEVKQDIAPYAIGFFKIDNAICSILFLITS